MAKSPTAETVQRFHQATGLGWMDAKRFLIEQSPELCARIIRAGEEQSGEYGLHDPIEDDPAFTDEIAAAREEAGKIARDEAAGHKQSCEAAGIVSLERSGDISLRTAVIMKELLQEKSIRWYTPMEMNPGSVF